MEGSYALLPKAYRPPKRAREIVSRQARRQLLQQYSNRCAKCREIFPSERLHVDHIKAFALGGTHLASNLQVLCDSCNYAKGADSADFRTGEHLVEQLQLL